MKYLVYTFALFGHILFFCLLALFGIGYSGDDSSSLYRNYCISIFIISMFVFLWDYIHSRFKPSHLFSFLALVLILIICAIEGYTNSTVFLCYVAFCIPASCVAIVTANPINEERLYKWLDVVFIFITVSLFFLMRGLLSRFTLGESNYSQRYSYYAAFACNLDLFLLFFAKGHSRFAFASSRWYRILCYLVLPVFPIIAIASGGRGGFLSMVVGLTTLLLIQGRNKRQWVLVGFLVLSLFFIGSRIADSSSFSQFFDRNAERVLSVIDSGRIDVTQSGGRNILYEYCWDLFKARPLTGYGVFSYTEYLLNQPYAHNLFLEWLLQGGIFYFLFWFSVLIAFLYKYMRLIKRSSLSTLLFPVIIFAFTELMFSSTYLEEPLFWFSIMFVLNYDYRVL